MQGAQQWKSSEIYTLRYEKEIYRVGTTMRWAKINRPWILRRVAKDNTEGGFQEALSSKSEKYTWEDGLPLLLAAAIEERQ